MYHPSQIFFAAALSFIIGIFISSFNSDILHAAAIGIGIGVIVLFLVNIAVKSSPQRNNKILPSRNRLITGFLIGVLFILGIVYGSWQQKIVALDTSKDVTAQIKINAYVEKTYYGYRFAGEYNGANINIRLGEPTKSFAGNAKNFDLAALSYGDLVTLRGTFEFNEKTHMYELAFPKVISVTQYHGFSFYRLIFRLRSRFENTIDQIYPQEVANFTKGILLGSDGNFSKELKADFKNTGTQHLTAVSGYNTTIIAFGLIELFILLGIRRTRAFLPASIVIIIFVFMTGASSATTRAGVMSLLLLASQNIGRLSSARNSLMFSALFLIILSPRVLRFDIGFQLSFLAAMGLLYFSPLIQSWLEQNKTIQYLMQYTIFKSIIKTFSETSGAQIAVLPWLLYTFKSFMLLALPANLIILPFIPWAMLAGFIGGLLGFIHVGLGSIAVLLTYPFIAVPLYILKFLGHVPGFNIGFIGGSLMLTVVLYMGVGYVYWLIKKKFKTT